jgi:hypothetical protein
MHCAIVLVREVPHGMSSGIKGVSMENRAEVSDISTQQNHRTLSSSPRQWKSQVRILLGAPMRDESGRVEGGALFRSRHLIALACQIADNQVLGHWRTA